MTFVDGMVVIQDNPIYPSRTGFQVITHEIAQCRVNFGNIVKVRFVELNTPMGEVCVPGARKT